MNYKSFIKQHRHEWKQLEELLTTIHKKKHSPESIEAFQRLYQKTAQHLSYSQTYFPGDEVTLYLNDLVSKAHNTLYQDRVSNVKQLKHFFGRTFIGIFVEQWKFVLVAMFLFLLGGTAAFLAVLQDPMNVYSVLPESMAQGFDPERLGEQDGAVDSSMMSVQIMTNNIRVAFLAFAGGITFGILTVYVLIYNGVIVGAIAAMFMHAGKSYEFWAYIVPHGIIELTAIFIAGGAGLLTGYKLFVPGHLSRIIQLKEQAYRSVILLIGTLPMFVIAGLIEGFITPAAISLEAKYAVAFITLIGLAIYISIGQYRRQKDLQVNNRSVFR
ncbi:stage II sporulation protein M [Halobacillus salinus]|uniref:Stage II sporulation protein M n=1 Tax=Halobacillus salinus TaxID=192814 RepID=A0A4Z0H033_9BACI|nr:stage II sporulation protein M [Halobacillus salinus]TGB02863.1 stage II sporulation protein M [Halobacillus salinus]